MDLGFNSRFKTNFLAGLIFILPIICTFWLVKFLIDLISEPLSVLSGQRIPEFISFIVTIFVIVFIGFIVRNIIGKAIVTFLERLMYKIPIINLIYKSIKQVVTAFTFRDKGLLTAVLVEYPRKGVWALGFLTKEDASGMTSVNGEDLSVGMSAVFMPTTPNPTSGYFIYVKKEEVKKLGISVENSIKILMSAGVVSTANDI